MKLAVFVLQKMGSGYHGPYYAGRKDMHFPPDSVESTQPLMNKRKRLTKNDIGNSQFLSCISIIRGSCG